MIGIGNEVIEQRDYAAASCYVDEHIYARDACLDPATDCELAQCSSGIRRYVEVSKPAIDMSQYDKHVRRRRWSGRRDKKGHGNHVWYVVLN